jgi:hypothetical protein
VFGALSVMVAKLPLKALDDAIERVLDVRSLGVCAERLPRDTERRLEAPVSLRPVTLGDHLDLDTLDASLQALEPFEFVEREIVEPFVDRDAAGLHDQIHAAPSTHLLRAVRSAPAAGAAKGSRLADLVFDPTLAC